MTTLVLYDSQFGNTQKVAEVIGKTLSGLGEVRVAHTSQIAPEALKQYRLLIVGSPTQAFRATKGMQEFLKKLPDGALNGARFAAFDTRINPADYRNLLLTGMVKLFGYAAKPLADLLVKKGAVPAVAPRGFYVGDKAGPLKDGELERASAWAGEILKAA